MADNTTVSTGASGNTSTIPNGTTFRLDDVGGVLYQVVKLDVGGDGASSPVTSLAKETGGNLAAIATALADPATETTLAAVLAALASVPVTGTFFQATQPVSAASLPLPTGAATETTLASILAALADPATETTLSDVLTAILAVGTAIADLATVTEAQPISDNGGSITVDGTVGISGTVTVGSHAVTNAGTFPVQNTPVVASAATLSNTASSATSVTLLSSNASRRGATIYNDSTQVLYVKFGATASSTSHTIQMAAGSYYEFPLPCYTGVVDGIWASANGSARCTELT